MGKKDSKKQKGGAPVKTKKAEVKPVKDSDEDSSEEEVQVKPQKQKAGKAKPPKVQAQNSSEEEESSEEEAPALQVKAPAKNSKDDSSDEEDDSEEEEVSKPTKRTPQTKQPATQKKAEDSDDDEDDDSDDSEEAAPAKKGPAAKPVDKRSAKESSDEDSDDDDDDDDDEEEEEAVKVPEKKKKGKNEPTAKKQKVKDAESDDDEVSESKNKKRKKEKSTTEPTPKKQKLEAANGEGETVTLFVGNLSKNTTEDDVSSFFSENSISVAAVRKPPNKSNAFVDLEDAEDLENALALNGSTLKKNSITVEKAKPRGQWEQNNQSSSSPGDRFNKGDDDKDDRTLFVKNLPEDATEESLGAIFDTASQVRIPQRDGVHKGFGFVEFADKEAMEAAKSEHQGAELNGNSLYLDYTGAKSSFKQRGGPGGRGGRGGGEGRRSNSGMRGESKVLYVRNLSYDTDESSLRAAFDGAVSARIPTFPDSGKPKGFAFVDFKSADAASEAFDSMNGQSIDGRQVTLDFAVDKGSSGGGGGGFGGGGYGGGGYGRGGGGRGGGFGRGRGGGFGGGRGGGGRGGPRGGGRGGGFNKARGGIVQSEGKKTRFDDSD